MDGGQEAMRAGLSPRLGRGRAEMSAICPLSGANRKTFTRLSLPLLNPKPTTEVKATMKTARSWRDIVPFYAPRTGGAYDSHHRTAGIAGRTRRRGGRVAARGARAAIGDAGGRVSEYPDCGRLGKRCRRVLQWHERDWLRRRPECQSRTTLGRRPT